LSATSQWQQRQELHESVHSHASHQEDSQREIPRELLAADPAAAMSVRAREHADLGQLDDALECCEHALNADKLNPLYHYLHGVILQEQGRFDEAATSIQKAVFLDPQMVVAHFALGNLARRQGRIKESDKHFETALKVLRGYSKEDVVSEAEGMTAGRLVEVIKAMTNLENS
jgi:chemotaxis protein methyltransferase CheR